MSKNFSPVRIQNPVSLQQFVKVNAGQSIFLYLDKKVYGEHEVAVSTDLLEISCMGQDKGVVMYQVTHSEEVHEWARYSSSLLGEIWIDGKDEVGKVGVLLESKNQEKSKVRTVVNPDCFDLRIYPYNILEVIVYDIRFGYHDEWNHEWKPVKEVGLDFMGYDHICLNSAELYYCGLESNSYLYARYPRTSAATSVLTRQHHFWFRLDNKVWDLVTSQSGIVHIGNLVITGLSNRYQLQYAEKTAYYLSLYVDCRKTCFEKIQETLNLKLRSDLVPEYNTHYSSNPSHYQKTKYVKKVLPQIRDVDIKLIEVPGEITGCNTLNAINDNFRPQQYDYGFDEYWHTKHARRHQNYSQWWRRMDDPSH